MPEVATYALVPSVCTSQYWSQFEQSLAGFQSVSVVVDRSIDASSERETPLMCVNEPLRIKRLPVKARPSTSPSAEKSNAASRFPVSASSAPIPRWATPPTVVIFPAT